MKWETWIKGGRFKRRSLIPIYLFFLSYSPFFFLFTFLIGTANSASVQISKRESTLIQIIEDHAVTLNPMKFWYDPIMVQGKPFSVYTDPNKQQGSNLIFRKRNTDFEQEAIALSSHENAFAIPTPRGGKKRQFILLVKSPNQGESNQDLEGEGTPYFASFVYVRHHLPNDSNENIFDVNGVKNVVEWDIWETRPKTFFAGWGTCEFTTLFTCESLHEMLDIANKDADIEKKSKKDRRRRKKRQTDSNNRAQSILTPDNFLTPIVSEQGFDPNEYNDLYLDLDFHRFEHTGKQVGRAFRTRKRKLKKEDKNREKRSIADAISEFEEEQAYGMEQRRVKRFGFPKQSNNQDKSSPQQSGRGFGSMFSGKSKAQKKEDDADPPEAEVEEDPESKKKGSAAQGRSFSGDASASGKAEGGGGGGKGSASVKASAKVGFDFGGALAEGGIFSGGFNKLSRGTNTLKKMHEQALKTGLGLKGAAEIGGGLTSLAGGVLSLDADPLVGLGGAEGLTKLLSTVVKPDALADTLAGADLGEIIKGVTDLTGEIMVGADADIGLKGLAAIGAGLSGKDTMTAGLGNTGGLLGGLAGSLSSVAGGAGTIEALSARLGELGSLDEEVDADGGELEELQSFGGLGAVVNGVNSLLGGNLNDVGVDGLANVLGGIAEGDVGPTNFVENLVINGLGSGSSIKTLLGPASGTFDDVNIKIKGLAGSLSGNNLIPSLETVGKNKLTGSVSGIVSSVLNGGVEADLSPLQMTQKILGPISTSLDKVTAIVLSSNAIAGGLPEISASMGHSVTKGLPSVTDSLAVEGLLNTVGLGPVPKLVPGLSDTIDVLGESILSPHDIIGQGVLSGAVESLVKLGLSVETAKLAAIGSQLCFVEDALQQKGLALGIRQVSASVGLTLNSGHFRGAGAGAATKGFKSWQKIMNMEGYPSNAESIFGLAYTGAGNAKQFFFPEGSFVRAVFKKSESGNNEKPIPGILQAGAAMGHYDKFFPDDAADAAGLVGVKGVIVPESYRQPNRDANNGIVGKIDSFNRFYPSAHPKSAVYHFNGHENSSAAFWISPDMENKRSSRPLESTTNKPMIYGYLFHGVLDSPHVFVPEGDSLSGFFVPEDKDQPEFKTVIHGIFIPTHPAGHAKFVMDDDKELHNVKELRGAFLPDAMNLAGAIGGKLSKTERSHFSFVLDHVATDFVYVKNHPSTANVWAAFLSKDEWNYVPPKVPPPKLDVKVDVAAGGDNQKGRGLLDVKLKVQSFGVKVETQATTAFIPEDFPLDGSVVLLGEGVKSLAKGKLTLEKGGGSWKIDLTAEANVDNGKPLVAIFVAAGYPKNDGFVGTLELNDGKNGGTFKISAKQAQSDHFYSAGEEIWIPTGFSADVNAGVDSDGPDAEAEEDPGSIKAVPPPDRPANYYFGPSYQAGPEMELENFIELPRKLVYGYYYIDAKSPGPLFLPDGGAAATFTPEGSGPQKGFIFPQKVDGTTSIFVPEKEGSIADGTTGTINTVKNKKDAKSKEFFKAVFKKDGTLEGQGVEVVTGWKYSITKDASKMPDPLKSKVKPENFRLSKNPSKYNLVKLEGGFNGVVVKGTEALDDPNNPIFQEFVHYKAHKEGRVNPWGNVHVFDTVSREEYVEGKGLPLGNFKRVLKDAPKAGKHLLNSFTFVHWEWPLARSQNKSTEAFKISDVGNFVTMNDFRMYLMRKYNCKRVKTGDKFIKLFTPIAAEPYLNVVEPSKPKLEWVSSIDKKERLVIPGREGIVGWYAQQNMLDTKDLDQFTTIKGSGDEGDITDFTGGYDKDSPWKKTASFNKWGDEHLCAEIKLNQLSSAEVTEDQPLSGVELGLHLVKNIGSGISYPQVASKLLLSVDRQSSREPPGGILDQLGATDLMGGVGVALKKSLVERKQAKVEANSEEVDVSVKQNARRKREDTEGETLEGGDGQPKSKNKPGWRTQFKEENLKDNITLTEDGTLFYGLGNCKRESVPSKELFDSKEPEKVIEYYLKILRIDCMKYSRKRVMELFNEHFLTFGESRNYFEIPKDNPIVNEERITPMEMRQLSVAFELSAFSKTYHKMRSNSSYPISGYINEPNTKITRSVGFLTEFAIYYINRARKVSPTHSVRLTRNLLKTLRTVLTKLHQDMLALKQKCGDTGCKLDKMLTEGDMFRVTCLMQFIIYGMGPVDKGGKPLRPTFYNFITLNKEAIKERVVEFERQYDAIMTHAASAQREHP